MNFLGINKRNDYLLKNNPPAVVLIVNDKLKTKELLSKNQIPTPALYSMIQNHLELRTLPAIRGILDAVIKPAHGSGGKGVLIAASIPQIRRHISEILSGAFSEGMPDQALIESRVKNHPTFEAIAPFGVADIRLIVYRGIPVMAMLRLPTRLSNGKANLHQGGVGVGIDMRSGKTTTATFRNCFIVQHPDTQNDLRDISIPFWPDILKMSQKSFEIFGLGYFGIDMVIDENLGPMVLELNSRPGLGIQLANGRGLLPYLEAMDRHEIQKEITPIL